MAFAKSPSSTSVRAVRLALESFNLPCFSVPQKQISFLNLFPLASDVLPAVFCLAMYSMQMLANANAKMRRTLL